MKLYNILKKKSLVYGKNIEGELYVVTNIKHN